MYAISKSSHTPKVHKIVLDIPVTAHLLKHIDADTFEDAQQILLQYVTSQRSYRVYVIWDKNLIVSAPERGVNVTRSSVAANTKTPST